MLWFFLSAEMARAGDSNSHVAKLNIKPLGTTHLEGLKWDLNQDAIVDSKGDTILSFPVLSDQTVHIGGTFGIKNFSLLFDGNAVSVDDKGHFTISTKVAPGHTQVTLLAISPTGSIEQGTYDLWGPPVAEVAKKHETKSSSKWGLGFGVGVSYLGFFQQSSGAINEWGITPKVSLSYQLGPSSKWDLNGSVFGTAALLGSNPSSSTIQFVGVNARLGYLAFKTSSGWSLKGCVGWYYSTSFTSSSSFGFQDVMGPQFFPVLSYAFKSGIMAWYYIKLSPIFDGSSLLGFSSGEFATGFGASVFKIKDHQISLTLDGAHMNLNYANDYIQVNSFTFGIGFQL